MLSRAGCRRHVTAGKVAEQSAHSAEVDHDQGDHHHRDDQAEKEPASGSEKESADQARDERKQACDDDDGRDQIGQFPRLRPLADAAPSLLQEGGPGRIGFEHGQ